jgi:hypothetical protein
LGRDVFLSLYSTIAPLCAILVDVYSSHGANDTRKKSAVKQKILLRPPKTSDTVLDKGGNMIDSNHRYRDPYPEPPPDRPRCRAHGYIMGGDDNAFCLRCEAWAFWDRHNDQLRDAFCEWAVPPTLNDILIIDEIIGDLRRGADDPKSDAWEEVVGLWHGDSALERAFGNVERTAVVFGDAIEGDPLPDRPSGGHQFNLTSPRDLMERGEMIRPMSHAPERDLILETRMIAAEVQDTMAPDVDHIKALWNLIEERDETIRQLIERRG